VEYSYALSSLQATHGQVAIPGTHASGFNF
jgi:hypothetical protein